MKPTIKISFGQYGLFLEVNGKAIKRNPNASNGVTATPCDSKPNNWIATEFATLNALRNFWNDYRSVIIHEANK